MEGIITLAVYILGIGLAITVVVKVFWLLVELFWDIAGQLVTWAVLAGIIFGWLYLVQYNNVHPIF